MQPHLEPRRSAAFFIRRIEGYRASPMGGRAACRFTPSCSYYAEEALRTRVLPVALLLISWRLLRCNPFMQGRVADPVRRQRHWRMRPNTLPTLFSILALSGFVVVVTAGVAQAVGVSNGCAARINATDPATLDQNHPLVVHRGENVRFVGVVPPSVGEVPSDQLTSNTHIDVDLVAGLVHVSSRDTPGHGSIWGGFENVDKYLGKTVGLYHVTGVVTGEPGGWSCEGDAYVELRDGSPLTKPVGGAALGLTVIGAGGALLSTRTDSPDAPTDGSDGEEAGAEDNSAPYEVSYEPPYEPSEEEQRRESAEMGMACLMALIATIGVTYAAKNVGAASVVAAVSGHSHSRRVWARGHAVGGFVSGLFMGIGITVLLQQYAVWPLTIVTAIIFPVVTAIICSLRAWLGRPYRFVARAS